MEGGRLPHGMSRDTDVTRRGRCEERGREGRWLGTLAGKGLLLGLASLSRRLNIGGGEVGHVIYGGTTDLTDCELREIDPGLKVAPRIPAGDVPCCFLTGPRRMDASIKS